MASSSASARRLTVRHLPGALVVGRSAMASCGTVARLGIGIAGGGGMPRSKRWLALVLLLASAAAWSQVPTSNVLFRVFRLKTDTGTGSAFTIEVDGKQYLITARHNLEKLGAEGSVELWIGGKWTPFGARAIYPSTNVDLM